MKVIFYNLFNNGDIHVSRSFIRKIIEIFPENEYFYAHKNSPELLKDINITHININSSCIENAGSYRIGDVLYINTWYASNGRRYMNTFGVTFSTLYIMFRDILEKEFKYDISNIEVSALFPSIDYSKFHISGVMGFLNNHKNNILICNGNALSGQADNFSFEPGIEILAHKYPSYNFLLTNPGRPFNLPNVFYTKNIIGKKGNDLNENSYLSQHCNVIIGRMSGVFTYSITYENFLNKNKIFINFSNIHNWIGDYFQGRFVFNANIINSEDYSTNNFVNTISQCL